MYLHLGQDTVVTLDEIIGIFDLDTTTVSKSTRNYLTNAEKAGGCGQCINGASQILYCLRKPCQAKRQDDLYFTDFFHNAAEEDRVYG